MVIGIECELSINSKDFYRFFNGINMELFSLVIVEEDFYAENNESVWPDKINGEIFIEKLKNEHPVVIFLNCQAFLNGCKHKKPVDDYKSFVESECVFAFFVIDYKYIEIYAKSELLLKRFVSNAEYLGCEAIVYKTKDNDSRTKFCVF